MSFRSLCYCFSAGLFLASLDISADAAPRSGYFNLGTMGEFLLGAPTVKGGLLPFEVDPRMGFILDMGAHNFAMPVVYSFGFEEAVNYHMVGIRFKPQWVIPFEKRSPFDDENENGGLYLHINVGPLVNLWYKSAGSTGLQLYEFGLEAGGALRWEFLESFNMMFSPLTLDFNFYRFIINTTSIDTSSDNTANADLTIFWTPNLSFGFVF